MLGRKRISGDNKINLYLQLCSSKALKSHFNTHILQKVNFLIKRSKTTKPHPEWENTYSPNIIMEKITHNHETFIEKYLPKGHYSKMFQTLIVKHHFSAKSDLERRYPLIYSYSLNSVALLQLTYDFYAYMSFFERQEQSSFSQSSYNCWCNFLWPLEQLSWLGLKYEYNLNILELAPSYQKLKQLCNDYSGRYLSQEETAEFRNEFLVLIRFISPHLIRSDSQLSISKVNEVFAAYCWPYKVKSKKKTIRGKQRNYWFIENNI